METDNPFTLDERINSKDLRPWSRLPLPEPKNFDPGPEWFYDNVLHPLVEDSIKMMCVGIHIDENAVESLRSTIDTVLSNVEGTLLRNPIIQKYQKERAVVAQKTHYAKCTENIRELSHYISEYKGTVVHRSWVVNTYLKAVGSEKDVKESWTLTYLKKYNVFKKDLQLSKLIDKNIDQDSSFIKNGMLELAKFKLDLFNRPRYEKGNSKASLDPFNPGSAKQKQELFSMLGIEPLAFSDKTDEGSWGRKYIETLLGSLAEEGEEDLKEVLKAIIDHSFSGIIRNNFLKAFDTYTLDEALHGNIKLFGAKSFRNTSNSPNLLNMPSSASKYAKPLKKCFVAPKANEKVPKGFKIYAIDLGALEDRVIANLSGDVNKSNIFLEGLDGHSLNACGYFPKQIAKVMGENTDNVAYVKEFYRLADVEKNPILSKLRSESKPPTFKLAYGGFPDADKGGVITKEIFENYHNILYPGITDYRENYVLPTTQENGYLHLGLGCRIYSDDAEGDIRTLNNATCQFWSILTLLAINELNYRIKEAGLEDKIQVCSTIYDSIYFYVENDAKTIKWLNDNAVETLCVDYIENQVVKNEAAGEVGDDWCDLHQIVNGASVDDIELILKKVDSNG